MLERPDNRFSNRTSTFNGLEKRELWRYSCHSRLTHEDCLLKANQDHDRRSWASKGHHLHGNNISRSHLVNCQ